jgi:hypothetical protein
MFQISKATRENVKLKLGLSGPSGSGKTYSALQLAYGISGDWSKIAVADTENESALYYANQGPWLHIPFNPDKTEGAYSPKNYMKLIKFAEAQPIEVLIIDSISHEWEGKGGCLDLVDQIGKGFASWKTVTPLHNAFMDAMRLSPLHIIATMRSKQDYVIEQNEKGKSTPRKVGLKSIQREGADYDFGIVFDIDINHFAKSSKDRTGLFMPQGEFKITPTIGKELIQWATSGVDAPTPKSGFDPLNKRHIEALNAALTQRGVPSDYWGEISKLMDGKSISKLQDVLNEYEKSLVTI